MSAVLDFLVGAALVVGLFFHTMGVLGILRFPDVYTRLHADTKATTFGSVFIALAAIVTAIRYGVAAAPGGGGAWANVVVHIVFAVVVLAVTNATGGHAIARAAWRAGHRPAQAVVDAMAAAEKAAKAAPEKAAPAVAEEAAAPEMPEIAEAPVAAVAAPEPETPELAEKPAEPAAEPLAEPAVQAAEIQEVSKISKISEIPEVPEAPEKPEETPLEAAAPEAAAPAEAFPKAAAAGWAAVLGITAEDPLLQAAEAPAAETAPEGPEAGEEEKA